MTELSGTLQGVGLPAILRFLGGLQKTGALRLAQDDWRGEVSLEAGQVTAARIGSRAGLPALEAMLQVLPQARFSFEALDSHAAGLPNTVGLDGEALQTHLASLASLMAQGRTPLPSAVAVPTLPAQEGSSGGEQSLALDRATLQTLLAVDGQRTVGEIVADQGSLEAWFQLDRLAELGVIQLSSQRSPGAAPPSAGPQTPEPRGDNAARATDFDRPLKVETASTPPAPAAAHCPKLGFGDDPSTTFGRPTRMHRCFAAEVPLPLSLDQQRELCLTGEYGTCPRYASAGGEATGSRDVLAEPDDPTASLRAGPWQTDGSPSEPTRLRPPLTTTGRLTPGPDGPPRPPTPLRARLEQARSSEWSPPTSWPGAAPMLEPRPALEPLPSRSTPTRSMGMPGLESTADSAAWSGDRAAGTAADPPASAGTLEKPSLLGSVPVWAIGAALLVVLVLVGVAVVWYLPSHPGRVSVAGVTGGTAPALPTTVRGGVANPLAPASQSPAAPPELPDPISARVTGPATAAPPDGQPASGAATAPAAPATVAQPTRATLQSSGTAPPTKPASAATLLDERFLNNDRHWPSAPQGAAVVTGGAYRLMPLQAGQFVAIGAPIANAFTDVVVNATFHKLNGPPGGGYGIIVRDQAPIPQNGTSQTGNYYVLEAGDKGEIGIWRRDGDRWTDLLAWRAEPAVKPGIAANELSARASGTLLTFLVNGAEVAKATDDTYTRGGVGLFVGGDGNEVSVDRFSIGPP